MSFARLPGLAAVLLLTLAGTVLADAAAGRTRGGRARGAGTLAYVVSWCRVHPAGLVGWQELRIRRDGRPPVTAMRFDSPTPLPDPIGICALGAANHLGELSPIAGVFQRLAVTPDGSGVVFEVSNQFQLVGRLPLGEDAQGFFYVRADGRGLRRLAPPSRDPVYRLFPNDSPFGAGVVVRNELSMSPNGRMIAYADLGVGEDGVESPQVFTLDLRRGTRRQVTRLPRAAAPRPPRQVLENVDFWTNGLIGFVHVAGDTATALTVRRDGRKLRPPPAPEPLDDGLAGPVLGSFGVTRRRYGVVERAMLAPPENPEHNPGQPAREIFRLLGRDLVQLTNFRRTDTFFLGARPRHLLFMASGDPLGTNPFRNCQLFRVSSYGGPPRQLTRFDAGVRAVNPCNQMGAEPGCTITYGVNPNGRSRSIVFYSDCDPLGTNPDGSQVFAVEWDGSGLRQLTDATGARRGADGVLETELPGPTARGGR